jgi:hypothetical protein
MDFSTALSLFVWSVRWRLKRGFPALYALEIPSANSRVARYRKAALCFFMCLSGLFLCGSLIRVFANAEIGDAVAWTGAGCFVIAAICVFRSVSINLQHLMRDWAVIGICHRCGRPAVIQISDANSETGEASCLHLCVQHAREYWQ